MSTARRLHHSYQEYLNLLEQNETKLEFCDGEIFAMAEGTLAHGELGSAVNAVLRNQLGGRCRVYTSDVKVRIEATDLSTFPDVSVVCGPRQTSSVDANAITNPSVLVEVTSRSTEDYDRGDKLSHYKQIPSLQAVVIVSHRRPQLTVVSRGASGWDVADFRSGERLTLDRPAVTMVVDDIYSGVELDSEVHAAS
jgi:Uma2 family endonuclease